MVVAVDLPTGRVLLAIDLPPFRPGERAAVGCTIVADLLVDVGLALVCAGGLA